MPRFDDLFFAAFIPSALRRGNLLTHIGLAGLIVWAAAGCEKPAPIRQYVIPGKVPAQLISTDRMIAAIIPRSSNAWFVKVVGPSQAIHTAEPEVRKFVTDLQFVGDSPDLASSPASWTRGSEKAMRFATFLIDTPEAQLDVSISSLPISGPWTDAVAMNVNRWRGQMKLEPLETAWAGATPIDAAGATGETALWIDLEGEMGGGPTMMPPSATASVAAAGSGPARPSAPPVTAQSVTPNEPSAPSPLTYDKPASWRDGKMSAMRLAAFEIGPTDAPAELTVIPAGGDLRGNVARWLQQIRTDVPDEAVDKALTDAESLQVSGRPAQRFILVGGGGEDSQSIDATIVTLDDAMSMFIKATGPEKSIAQERDAIGEFLQTLKFK